jgi:hypothetical protein
MAQVPEETVFQKQPSLQPFLLIVSSFDNVKVVTELMA